MHDKATQLLHLSLQEIEQSIKDAEYHAYEITIPQLRALRKEIKTHLRARAEERGLDGTNFDMTLRFSDEERLLIALRNDLWNSCDPPTRRFATEAELRDFVRRAMVTSLQIYDRETCDLVERTGLILG